MKITHHMFAVTALLGTLALGAPASAQVVQFTGSDNGGSVTAQPKSDTAASKFLTAASAFGAVSTINFNGVTPGFGSNIALAGATLALSGANYGTEYSGITNYVQPYVQNLYGYNIGGGTGYYLGLTSSMATFTLATASNAFGFYTTGTQSQFGSFTVSFDGLSATTLSPVSNVDGGATYFGFTSANAFRTVTINTLNNSDAFGIDNVSFNASAVPEPASWAMMILGMGLIGAALRRRIKVSEVNFTRHVRAIAAS